MNEIIYSIIYFVIAVGVLISFHEYGHFWVARQFKVYVIRFSIGFGPKMFGFVSKKTQTEYVVAAIPLGGYVRMLDEARDEVSERLQPFAFNRKPLYQRTAIVAAGPLANFLLAVLLFWCVFLIGTEGMRPVVGTVVKDSIAERAGFQIGDEIVSINGRRNQIWEQHRLYMLDRVLNEETVEFEVVTDFGQRKLISIDFGAIQESDTNSGSMENILGVYPAVPVFLPIISEVTPNGVAKSAGMRSGDQILQIDGIPVQSWQQMVNIISGSANKPLTIMFQRDDELMEVPVTPAPVEIDGRTVGQIGVAVDVNQQSSGDAETRAYVRYGVVESLVKGVEATYSMSVLTIKVLASLLDFSTPADSIGGPVTIAYYAGKAAKSGISNYLMFLALLSISLGLLNLLPIPVLDGGHLLFYLYEAITGSPPGEKALIRGNQIGLILILGLMTLALYNDFTNLF